MSDVKNWALNGVRMKDNGDGTFDLYMLAPALGEVQASPTQYTLAERLKVVATALGEVQASPTQYTLLDRIKALETAIGSPSDVAWSGTGDGSVIAVLKKLVP